MFQNCTQLCGWIAAIIAATSNGSFGVPIKLVSKIDVDPLVFQVSENKKLNFQVYANCHLAKVHGAFRRGLQKCSSLIISSKYYQVLQNDSEFRHMLAGNPIIR